MRATESILRGVRSESGMRMENSLSRALTMSVSAKESSTPDSNRDSSGARVSGLPDSFSTISVIFACLFIRGLVGYFGADFQVAIVQPHYILKERGGQSLITERSEVHVVALSEAGHDPVDHGSFGAHAGAGIPVGAAVEAAGLQLGGDDAVHAFEGTPAALDAVEAVGRTQHQDGSRGHGAAQTLQDGGEGFQITCLAPLSIAGLVGAVGQHDQRGVAALEIGVVHGLIPAPDERGFGAVDAHGFVSDSLLLLGDPTEETDGRVFQRAQLETMAAGGDGVFEEASHEGTFGGGLIEGLTVRGQGEAPAAGLLQVVDFDGVAIRVEVDELSGPFGGDADAAEAEQPIAFAGAQAGGFPILAGAAAHIVAAIAFERRTGKREARAPIAEAMLEEIAEHAGPIVGGGVGIAEVQDVDTGAVAAGEAVQALEEGHQRAGPVDHRVGAFIQSERNFL